MTNNAAAGTVVGMNMGVAASGIMGGIASQVFSPVDQSSRRGAAVSGGAQGNSQNGGEGNGRVCPSCGTLNSEKMKFCGNCGAKLEKVKVYCPACGAEIPDGMKFCGECGRRRDE